MNDYRVPSHFFRRHLRQIQEGAVILGVLSFAIAYKEMQPLKKIIDVGLTPAVAGISVLYGKIATEIYKLSRLDLGFVTIPPDQDFLFSVRLATYVNQKRAGPLLDIAVDSRLPVEKRERALMAILKFETTTDWVQPFLNELPRGGLLGMYDDDTPLLDELIKKIRAEGGVRRTLVRAYAEAVFSFMLQLPDVVVRRHAYRWLSDVIAEDALFLLIPRFEKEMDPKGQEALEAALYDIRAVSEPDTAKELLRTYYRKPPWPGLRLPLAMVLARLGYPGAVEHVNSALKSPSLSNEKRLFLSLASERTPYPRRLKISDNEQILQVARRRAREENQRLAMERRRKILEQERMKLAMIARAESKRLETKNVVPTPVKKIPEQVDEPIQDTAVESKSERVPPKSILPIPGALDETDRFDQEEQEKSEDPEQYASLPDETSLPPPLEEPAPKSKSLINYVDMIFEVKKQQVPLYQNPGDSPTGVSLPVGTKGKADFQVFIGEDQWYQVKTKRGSGWANGKLLALFNLSPMGTLPPVATESQAESSQETPDRGRDDSTYFEASVANAPIFNKPSPKAKETGKLVEEVAYLAVRSEKVGVDRWFLLQIRSGETGWARGLDVRLADVQQPSRQIPSQPLSSAEKKSMFKAEWIAAGVKGVGVYQRPSIMARIIQKIDPPKVYKVTEILAADGKEWYKIELPEKKEGWVQTMDVNLTKKDSK